MHAKTNHLFRKTSLDRLSTPEQLDQVVRVIQPKAWLPLGTLGMLACVGLGWSILGRIPITVTGQGVLINPRAVTAFQSPVTGQLESIHVQAGQEVAKDDVLATIDPLDLKHQLEQERQRLTQLKQQTIDNSELRHQRTQLEQVAMTTQRTQLEQQLLNLQTLAPELQTQTMTAIATQRASLHQQLRDAQQLAPAFEARFHNHQDLASKGAISTDTLLQAEQEYRQMGQTIADLKAQLEQLEVQALETRERHLDNQNRIAQLQTQLDDLNTRSKQIEQDNLEAAQQRDREIQDIQREIARLEDQIATQSQIKSSQAGRIVEMTASVGQVVNPGAQLGTMQSLETAEQPIDSGVVYFSIQDGKQIQPGMTIFITPVTVKRERFGSIVAEVSTIAPLPITREGANSVIGNPQVVDHLLGQQEAQIEVFAELQDDPSTYSGYRWSSSKGPDQTFTPGTTFTARVVIEERAPITFLLPLLKQWTGAN